MTNHMIEVFVTVVSACVRKLQISPQKINLTKPAILHEMTASKPDCLYVVKQFCISGNFFKHCKSLIGHAKD